ncbi:MAG: nucleotidyltransferase domain-containing protein [Candidatus Pacearchaeota archaeon]|nr:nucleotidyltransferase domain-containing protein [Candidatus Pacearchaeota archaeon]
MEEKEKNRLLEYFFEEPEREFHVRELAKILKKSPTTISKYLGQLKKTGVLVSERKLSHLLFKANLNSFQFKDLKLFYNIKNIKESGLLGYLNEELNHPQAIILFGSFAKSENIKKSDIDLFIITSIKKELDLKEFEKKLCHEIQLFLHSNKEVEEMKQKKEPLLNSIINGVVLEGYWELLK